MGFIGKLSTWAETPLADGISGLEPELTRSAGIVVKVALAAIVCLKMNGNLLVESACL